MNNATTQASKQQKGYANNKVLPNAGGNGFDCTLGQVLTCVL